MVDAPSLWVRRLPPRVDISRPLPTERKLALAPPNVMCVTCIGPGHVVTECATFPALYKPNGLCPGTSYDAKQDPIPSENAKWMPKLQIQTRKGKRDGLHPRSILEARN